MGLTGRDSHSSHVDDARCRRVVVLVVVVFLDTARNNVHGARCDADADAEASQRQINPDELPDGIARNCASLPGEPFENRIR